MITTFWYQDGETTERVFSSFESIPMEDISSKAYVWNDLQEPSGAEEARILKQWGNAHELVMEDIQRSDVEVADAPHHPKVDELENHLFMILRAAIMPERGKDENTYRAVE